MTLLLEWTIKTALITGLAFAASRFMRRRSAAMRHLVWVATICTIILLPFCTLLIPSSLHSSLPAPIARNLPYSAPAASVDALTPQASSGRSALVPLSWPALIWLVGSLSAAAVLVDGSLKLFRTSRESTRFLDARWARAASDLSRAFGLRRSVRLLQSSYASMPMTWGWLRPQILLPANAENWSDKHIRFVLSHELAHIRRYDWPAQMLAEIVRVMYWFNPLLWIACNRLRHEGERACDDAVLLLGVDGTEYAAHLLEVARTLKAKRAWLPALAMARPSRLERRFAAMVDPSLDRRNVTRNTLLVAALLVLLVVLPLAALRAQILPPSITFGGNVYDSKGTAITDATITLTRTDDPAQRMTTTTSRTGAFEFSKLAVGHYRVDISRAGFAALHIDDIDIAGQSTPLNAMLPAYSGEPAERPKGGPRGSGGPSNPTLEYRVGAIKFTGAKAINEAQIRLALGLAPGEVYDEERLRSSFDALKKIYGTRGYINFVPMPVFDFDEQQKVVNLTINIDEDRQFSVHRINFTGNTTTPDAVIRREIMIKEGEVFNSLLWDLSLSRLNRLGYFKEIKYEDVEITLAPTEPTLDINLRVREK